MNALTVDAIAARAAETFSRRSSLLGVAGAVAAGIVAPSRVRASKAAKKAKKMCRKQIGQCEGAVADFCPTLETIPPDVCEEALLSCCAAFQGCQAGDAYGCILDGLLLLEDSLDT